jgi:hypothetical protein
MPLARIISRSSDACHELAMDLLARGYAVEVVSPDKIPDNFADLELRVDSAAPNSVTANVSSQDAVRLASRDLVDHLNEPMPDFVRRPPTMDELVAAGIATGAERKMAAQVIAPVPVANHRPATRSIASVPPTPEQVAESPERVAEPAKVAGKRERRITIKFRRLQLERFMLKIDLNTFVRSNPWLVRTSAGFAAVVVLGVLLVMGVRGVVPLVQSAAAGSKKSEAKTLALPAMELQGTQPSAPKSGTSASPESGAAVAQNEVAPKTESAKGKPKTQASLTNDLKLDPPTVYHERPATRAASISKRAKSHHHHSDSVIAKDTVTYIDKGFTPKNHLP